MENPYGDRWLKRRLVVRLLLCPECVLEMGPAGVWTAREGFVPPTLFSPGPFAPDPIGDVLRNADFMRKVEVLEMPEPLPPEAFDIPDGAIP